MTTKLVLAAFCLQAVAFCLFGYQLLASIIGHSGVPLSWEAKEMIEVTSLLGMLTGSVWTLYVLRITMRRNRKIEEQLQFASTSFHQVLLGKFETWGLTEAESQNALMLIKGFSISEIAQLHGKSEGTIKAQNTALYAKSGLAGRAQFVSYFLEELTADL